VPDAEGREQHAAVFVAKVVDDVDEQQGIVHGAGDVPGARPSGNGAGARPGFGARSTGYPEDVRNASEYEIASCNSPPRGTNMGIGVSLILIAVGAILTWAVSADVSGVDLQTVGVILMVVGAVGALLSLVFWSSWGGFGGRETTIVRDGERVVER